MRKAILVLGMHRSGTSAVTRVLNLLGAELPANLMPAAEDNKKGFWESRDLMVLHDEALASNGLTWDDWRGVPESWHGSTECEDISDRLAEVLVRDFSDSRLFAVKDPRSCRFVPMWLKALNKIDVQPLALMPFRNPLEVAASLSARNGFDVQESVLLWLRHVLDAEKHSRELRRTFVSFDAILSDWKASASRIGSDLGIEWPIPIENAAEEIEDFLSMEERHHKAGQGDGYPFSQWTAPLYRTLLSESAEGSSNVEYLAWDSVASGFEEMGATFSSIYATMKRREISLKKENSTMRSDLDKANRILEINNDTIAKLRESCVKHHQRAEKILKENNALRSQLSTPEVDGTNEAKTESAEK